ncbi:hypothetical protein N8E87_03405 [Avibacterium paragallinarum]|uniref:hypothetical protein n=1 Tax=Avibacterium paragallinarum TaxID=728 RepID=UPI0021F6C2DA|nr:hypothetical protein [Avibacterium paragallinarum]UXN37531.1 hypothetical protein N8E87_03405 [Avibacterium paragallinarum]
MSLLQQIDAISLSRLTPYKNLCTSNNKLEEYKLATCVYLSLQHRTGIFFSLIQELEVAIRNEMSKILKNHVAPNKDLLAYFCFLACDNQSQLSTESKRNLKLGIASLLNLRINQITNARTTERTLKNRRLNENDLIAAITFGFWVHLLNDDINKNPHFLYWSNIFSPLLFGGRFNSTVDIFKSLRTILAFRNKLYHQEPVWKKRNVNTPHKALSELQRKYQLFLTYLSKIAPYRIKLREKATLQKWLDELNFNPEVFDSEVDKLKAQSFI